MRKTKKNSIKALAIVLAVLLTAAIAFGIWAFPVKGKANNEFWLSSDTYRLEDTVVLQKEPGKDFKILNLADIQYDDLYDIGQKKYTEETIRQLVKETQPDLITMTGDQVWAPFQKHSQKDLIRFMDSFGIPWAPVFGNHDGEGNAEGGGYVTKLLPEGVAEGFASVPRVEVERHKANENRIYKHPVNIYKNTYNDRH